MAWAGRNPLVDEMLPPGGPVTSGEPVLGGAEGVSPTAKLVWDLARALLSQNPATTAGPQVGVVTGPMRAMLQSTLLRQMFQKLEKSPMQFYQTRGTPLLGSVGSTGTLQQWKGALGDVDPSAITSLRPTDVLTKYGKTLKPGGGEFSVEDAAIHESLHNLYKARMGAAGKNPGMSPAVPSKDPEKLRALAEFYIQRGLLPAGRVTEIPTLLGRPASINDVGEAAIEGMTNMILQRQGRLGASKFGGPFPSIPALTPSEWSRRTAEWLKTRYPTTGGTPQ